MFDLWKLQDYAPGEGETAGAFKEDYDHSAWIDVSVPGDVHRALMAAGRIENPFYDRNELECAWIEDREWWYRLAFDGPAESLQPGERLQLVFHGLDTFVVVWLNGEKLGQHANMFCPAIFDVSDKLRTGQPNTLALCFERPLDHVPQDKDLAGDEAKDCVFMRKGQYGYGWDWGPRLPTVGLWRPVELQRQKQAAIQSAHFYTLEIDAQQDRALVAVKVEVERFATDQPLAAQIRLAAIGGSDAPAIEQTITVDSGDTATTYLQVENPQLWWTHDLGDPALYDLRVTLLQGDVQLDEYQAQVGIRTIELDQSLDMEEPGTRFFRFVLNGVPIFAKGANWIPADSFVGAIPAAHYEMLIKAAQDSNMNMLRVWGGGIYEHDVFYDLCNQLGILVWQDFMFACAPYPEHDEIAAEVDAEARYQVRRLRSHPCLAVWCGNNENQWIYEMRHFDDPEYVVPGALYYDHILPQAVTELDGQVPYWPGSPYGGNDHNAAEDGDRHNWHVWHGASERRFGDKPITDHSPAGVSYRRYAQDMGRFISEFGMHASPVHETLRRCIPADQLFHHSPSMDHHNKDNPKNKGDNLMETVTGLPETLDDYIDFSMIAQAEGLKFGIEHYRRRKPHCSGTLFWQLNDCWPVLSWSVVDYHGFGKAGYFYSKRVYAPVLASFKALDDGGVELWITNDTLDDLADTATVQLRAFTGKVLWQGEREVHIATNGSQCVWTWQAGELSGGPDCYLSVCSANDLFDWNRHFFAPIKDLQREAVEPTVTITPVSDHEVQVRLEAPAYAFFVHLTVPHEATRYSDNYFDLEPGASRTIAVTNGAVNLTPDMVTVRWR